MIASRPDAVTQTSRSTARWFHSVWAIATASCVLPVPPIAPMAPIARVTRVVGGDQHDRLAGVQAAGKRQPALGPRRV
jgi:hypothetical protein